MRGDVRAVERSEGRLEGATAGEGNSVLLLFGMAADAAAGLCEIFAPLGIALSEGATEGGTEHEAEKQPNRGSSGPGHDIKHNKDRETESPAERGFRTAAIPGSSSASRGNPGGRRRRLCRPRRSRTFERPHRRLWIRLPGPEPPSGSCPGPP